MTKTKPPRAPAGLGLSGRRLWASVMDGFDLDQHERSLLIEACRTVDPFDLLDRALVVGVVLDDGRINPALVEARQQRLALTRLLAALRLPEGVENGVPICAQRRGGARRPYNLARKAGGQ